MYRGELHAHIRVRETHDWVARDGNMWVFVLVTVSFDFSSKRLVTAVLVREGDK